MLTRNIVESIYRKWPKAEIGKKRSAVRNSHFPIEFLLKRIHHRSERRNVIALEGFLDKGQLLAAHMRRREKNPFWFWGLIHFFSVTWS
jgi:hypothetical protein